jgi:hypothetical protein
MSRTAKKDTVPIGIRLERDTARTLRIFAAERMMPMAAVVTGLIEAFLRERSADQSADQAEV